MSKSSLFSGLSSEGREDIRLALKLPGRSSLEHRQVSSAFKKITQVLRSSPGGGGKKTGISSRQRGAGVGAASARAGSAASVSAPAGAKPGGASAHLQRVAVRWTYSKNMGDGQWGAHGRYIERESSQEISLDREAEPGLAPEIERGPDPARPAAPERDLSMQGAPESFQSNGPKEASQNHDRYSDPAAVFRPTLRSSALLKSHAKGHPRLAPAKSIHDLRRLSDVPLVRCGGRSDVLLPVHERTRLLQREPQRPDAMRRGSDGERGTPGVDGKRRVGKAKAPKPEGLGFGHAGDGMRVSETLNSWQTGGDQHIFKLIVSPEFGGKLDLKRHVSELVAKMEKDLGTKLQWVAVNHYNTDDPHAHVAIRGVDDRGHRLEVSPDYIKQGSRIRAQEAATRQLGYRSDRDVAEGLDRQVAQQRFTDLDRTLLRKAVNQEVSYEGKLPASQKARDTQLQQIRRLAQLEAMGLAQKSANMRWRLSPSLESALRQMQVSQDRLKSKFQHRELISDPSAPLVQTELKALGQRVSGKLVGTGHNEATGRPYMLVEGFDSQVHYVNQTPKVQRMRGAGELKVGDFIALQVVERKGLDGSAAGLMVRAESFGKALRPDLLDKELLQTAKPVEPGGPRGSVVHAFRQAAAHRLDQLRKAGAVEVADGQIRAKSLHAYDRLRYADAGMIPVDYAGGATLGQVVAKGRASIALRTDKGVQVLSLDQLKTRELDPKFIGREAMVFVGQDLRGNSRAVVIKPEQMPALVKDPRTNKLDLIATQIGALPAGHPVEAAVRERIAEWDKRGVSVKSADFGRDSFAWRQNMELGLSAELPAMVQGRRLNRLDWMLQQAYTPTAAPLEHALRERAEVWIARGINPMDAKFSLKANSWRKSVELHEAAQAKGVGPVIEELAKERGLPHRELASEPGRQVSGRVLLVRADQGETSVVIDTGRELTLLRQPSPTETELKAGMRVRARAEEVEEKNTQRRVALWRFADLEREQARAKGRERSMF